MYSCPVTLFIKDGTGSKYKPVTPGQRDLVLVNKKDLIEIADNIKDELKIIFVSKIDEVISNALVDLPKTLSALDASTLSSENKSIINDEFNISHWLKWHVYKFSFKIQFIIFLFFVLY